MAHEHDEVKDTAFSGKSCFSTIVKFQNLQDDSLIQTKIFIEACYGVVSILDSLGTAFSIPKKDVLGNIKRIDECHSSNCDKYKTLNVYMETKQCTGAILWLKRALEFLLAFIDSILQDHAAGVETESLKQNVLQAYEGSLKQYHGRMTRFIFSNISRLVPHRKDFLKAIMTEKDATTDMVFHDLQLYLPNFKQNIEEVDRLLRLHDLDEQKVV